MRHHRLVLPAALSAVGFIVYHFTRGDGAGTLSLLVYYTSGIVAWIALAWFGARLADALIARATRTFSPVHPPTRLLNDLLHALFFVVAAVTIFSTVFAQDATGLIATSSVTIAVIGFSLRYIIADVFSGIVLNFDDPYNIGDWIEPAPGLIGKVTEITWRTTRMETRDGVMVVIPNGKIATERLQNLSTPKTTYRAAIRLWLDARQPVERVKDVLMAGAFVAERSYPDLRPDVLVQEVGESGVLYLVRFWVPDAGEENTCRDSVLSALMSAMQRANCMPAPPRRVVTDTGALPTLPSGRDCILQSDFFGVFTQEERDQLIAAMKEHRLRRGTVLFEKGDPGGSLFFVVEGMLEVATDDGVSLDRMVPGDVFGEVSLLTGAARTATITALIDTHLYELGSEIEPVIRERPEILDTLAGLMSERMHRNRDRLRALHANHEPTREEFLTRFRAFLGV